MTPKGIRRETLARLLRRKRVETELRKRKLPKTALSAMTDSLVKARFGAPAVETGRDTKARRAMDAMLADMKRYDPKLGYKKGEKKIRIVVECCKVPCEECLAETAMIYSTTFKKQLCLNCEEKLTIDVGSMAFDRFKKKKRTT